MDPKKRISARIVTTASLVACLGFIVSSSTSLVQRQTQGQQEEAAGEAVVSPYRGLAMRYRKDGYQTLAKARKELQKTVKALERAGFQVLGGENGGERGSFSLTVAYAAPADAPEKAGELLNKSGAEEILERLSENAMVAQARRLETTGFTVLGGQVEPTGAFPQTYRYEIEFVKRLKKDPPKPEIAPSIHASRFRPVRPPVLR